MAWSPTLAVQREAFYAAFRDGDLAVIEAFLAQPAIHAEVITTNTYIATHEPSDVFALPTDCPWFCEPAAPSQWPFPRDPLLTHAVRAGHAHVVEWFFVSSERLQTMGATLAALLPLLTPIDDERYPPLPPQADPHILEVLLESQVFRELVSPENQQLVLDSIAAYSRQPEMKALAIAHGAKLETPMVLEAIARYVQTLEVVDLIVRDGAFLVGADVLASTSCSLNVFGAVQLLKHGVDFGNRSDPNPLVLAVEKLAPVQALARVLLETGFTDVDVRRRADGATALMVVAGSHTDFFLPNGSRDAAAVLLACGADHTLTTNSGATALNWAVRVGNRSTEKLLRNASRE